MNGPDHRWKSHCRRTARPWLPARWARGAGASMGLTPGLAVVLVQAATPPSEVYVRKQAQADPGRRNGVRSKRVPAGRCRAAGSADGDRTAQPPDPAVHGHPGATATSKVARYRSTGINANRSPPKDVDGLHPNNGRTASPAVFRRAVGRARRLGLHHPDQKWCMPRWKGLNAIVIGPPPIWSAVRWCNCC